MSNKLTDVDKKKIKKILGETHCDTNYFNMEVIHNEIEKLLETHKGKESYIKKRVLTNEYEEDEKVDDFEYEICNILMGKLFIEKDISDQQELVIGEIKEWLKEKYGGV